jgi:Lon protease-like protein
VCTSLPLFPLPDAVLLPGMVMPLHVFEPRYRSLVQHLRERTPILGIATTSGPEEDGRPAPVHREIGVGMLVGHQGLPDGRSNILVQHLGVARYRRDLVSTLPFRLVEATLQPDVVPAPDAVARLRLLVLQLGALRQEAEEEAKALSELSDTALVDGLARRVLADADERRAYLAADGRGRVALVQGRLAEFLAGSEARAEA